MISEYKKEELIAPWECTFGNKSHINLAGKILFSPFLLIICLTFNTLDLLFGSNEDPFKRGRG